MDKIAGLRQILTANPEDAFALYGLAMEYANHGNDEAALAEFNRLLSSHPEYSAGYFMSARTLVKTGRVDEAKARLKEGLEWAGKAGTQHAAQEMQSLLDEIS